MCSLHRSTSGNLDFKTDGLTIAKSGDAYIYCPVFVLYSLEQTKCSIQFFVYKYAYYRGGRESMQFYSPS